MTTLIGIHYESPADDPLKLPRPHWFDRADRSSAFPAAMQTKTGECGAVQLLGFGPVVGPPDDQQDPSQWISAAEILFEPDTLKDQLVGWYASFIDLDPGPHQGCIFTYENPIDRIETVETSTPKESNR